MTRHPLCQRSFQVIAVGAAYALWLLTQHLLESTRGSVYGFTDETIIDGMMGKCVTT